MIRKIVLIMITVLLGMTMLSACGRTPQADAAAPAAAPEDIVEHLTGISKDTEFLKLDGEPVLAEEYLYWTCQSLDAFYTYGADAYQFDPGDSRYGWIEEYWSTGLQPAILNCLSNYYQAKLHARDYDVTPEETEIKSAAEEMYQNTLAGYDSEAAFHDMLAQMCMTESGYRKLCEESIWYRLLYEKLYEEGGALYPDDQAVLDYAEEAGYYNCKYVYLSTTGTYTNESRENVHKRALEAYDIITSDADPDAALTDFLKNSSWNEDTDENEKGLLTSGGWLDDTFDKGVRALDIGEITLLEDETYGYFIVERLPIVPADLRSTCSAALYSRQIQSWSDNASVEYSKAYEDFDFRQFYVDLTQYRQETDAEPAE